jgi:hypothetical protein
MPDKCIEVNNIVSFKEGIVVGNVIKVPEISFLGDVDRNTGIIISNDMPSYRGVSIANKILVVKRFRGSTVGTYILYALCKHGLAPKAILMSRPDPVVIGGIILCDIYGASNIPEHIFYKLFDNVTVSIHFTMNSLKICTDEVNIE